MLIATLDLNFMIFITMKSLIASIFNRLTISCRTICSNRWGFIVFIRVQTRSWHFQIIKFRWLRNWGRLWDWVIMSFISMLLEKQQVSMLIDLYIQSILTTERISCLKNTLTKSQYLKMIKWWLWSSPVKITRIISLRSENSRKIQTRFWIVIRKMTNWMKTTTNPCLISCSQFKINQLIIARVFNFP